jgi:hypothetical protein
VVAKNGAQLGRERQPIRRLAPVDRIGAEPVADEQELSGIFVENRDTEGALQPRRESRALVPIERRHERRSISRSGLTEPLDHRCEIGLVVQVAMNEHPHRTTARQLRGRLQRAEMHAPERPALLRIDVRFADHPWSALHGAEHGCETPCNAVSVRTAYDTQQARHSVVLRSSRPRGPCAFRRRRRRLSVSADVSTMLQTKFSF